MSLTDINQGYWRTENDVDVLIKGEYVIDPDTGEVLGEMFDEITIRYYDDEYDELFCKVERRPENDFQ